MLRDLGQTPAVIGIGGSLGFDSAITPAGGLDALIALESIGTRQSFARNQEIYAEGDACKHWYKVVSGTVRICKLFADGRRHIAEFCFSGDCFGLEDLDERAFAAEAVDDAIVMCFPRGASERLADESPALGRLLREAMLRNLTAAHARMLLLGRMDAPQRVAHFLIEMGERKAGENHFDLPMSRNDIADYLGLTVETVCRVLSAFKRDGSIEMPQPHHLDIRKRDTLDALAKT